MDLNKMVNDSLIKMEESGEIEKIVHERVSSSIEAIVKDVFGSYSDFSKELTSTIQSELSIDFSTLKLQSYNHLILQSVKDVLDDEIRVNGVNQVTEHIKVLLSEPKKDVNLSDIIKDLAEELDEDVLRELDYESSHEMSLHIEQSYGSHVIAFDKRSDIDQYECQYRLHVSSDGTIYAVKVNDNEYGNGKINNNFDLKTVLSGIYGVERTLFSMYVSGSKLIIDENACDTELSNPEYD